MPTVVIQFEKLIYGDTPGNGLSDTPANDQTRKLNLRGKPYQHYDTAGLVISLGHNPATGTDEAFDFKGNPLRSTRQLVKDYKNTPDWSQNPNRRWRRKYSRAAPATMLSTARSSLSPRIATNPAPSSTSSAPATTRPICWNGWMSGWNKTAEPTALLDPTTANLKAVS